MRAKLAENQLVSSNIVPAEWQSMYWCRHSGWEHPVAYSQRTCSGNVITQPIPSIPSTGKYVTFKSACLTLAPTKSMRWKWRDDDDVADANAKGQEQGAVLQLAESTFEISHRTIIMAATAFNSNPCTISVFICGQFLSQDDFSYWFCHFGLVMLANRRNFVNKDLRRRDHCCQTKLIIAIENCKARASSEWTSCNVYFNCTCRLLNCTAGLWFRHLSPLFAVSNPLPPRSDHGGVPFGANCQAVFNHRHITFGICSLLLCFWFWAKELRKPPMFGGGHFWSLPPSPAGGW